MRTVTETKYLAGRVIKQSLQALTPPTGPDAPVLKRLLLPNGELAQFHDSDEPARYIAFIELRTGTVRGHHYHRLKEEIIYLISGELRLHLEDIETKLQESFLMTTGDRVRIPVGIAHTLEVTQAGQGIEFSSARFDPADTYRYPMSVAVRS